MNARRTDLALEAHALFRAAQRDDAIDGLTLTERTRRGCAVTPVTVEGEAASRALGKPRGTYVTLDLRALSPEDPAYTERAALALRDELRALLEGTVDTALVVGLGNRAMTPDVIGPRAADHVPATRHLKGCAAFGALADVSVLTPGVLGTTGLEAAELVRGPTLSLPSTRWRRRASGASAPPSSSRMPASSPARASATTAAPSRARRSAFPSSPSASPPWWTPPRSRSTF